jgi:hypothetical protein
MGWDRERDDLIAKTLAFVQSAATRREATDGRGLPVAQPRFEIGRTAASPAEPTPTVPAPTVPAPLARGPMAGRESPDPGPRMNEASRPLPPFHSDFRSEIRERVANFRAHQERFNREREAYFNSTLARLRAALDERAPLPPGR